MINGYVSHDLVATVAHNNSIHTWKLHATGQFCSLCAVISNVRSEKCEKKNPTNEHLAHEKMCVWHENTQRNSQWTLAKANGVKKKLRESSLYRSIGISMSHKNKKIKITKIYSAGETLHCTPNGIKTIRKIKKIFKHTCIGERRTRENDLFSTFWMLFFARWGPSAGRNSRNIHMWCARVCLCHFIIVLVFFCVENSGVFRGRRETQPWSIFSIYEWTVEVNNIKVYNETNENPETNCEYLFVLMCKYERPPCIRYAELMKYYTRTGRAREKRWAVTI